jgi:hypothetical protein
MFKWIGNPKLRPAKRLARGGFPAKSKVAVRHSTVSRERLNRMTLQWSSWRNKVCIVVSGIACNLCHMVLRTYVCIASLVATRQGIHADLHFSGVKTPLICIYMYLGNINMMWICTRYTFWHESWKLKITTESNLGNQKYKSTNSAAKTLTLSGQVLLPSVPGLSLDVDQCKWKAYVH